VTDDVMIVQMAPSSMRDIRRTPTTSLVITIIIIMHIIRVLIRQWPTYLRRLVNSPARC